VLGVVNCHPSLPIQTTIHWCGLGPLRTTRAWILSDPDPLAANSFDSPNQVVTREVLLPEGAEEVGMSLCLGVAGELTVRETPPQSAGTRDAQIYRFPAASVTVIELR
jgi:hypothetical protein